MGSKDMETANGDSVCRKFCCEGKQEVVVNK